MTKFWSILIAAASISKGATSQSLVDPNSQARHNANSHPLELNVDAKTTYNDKIMALMESPCRPESDGFFGATAGVPVVLTYGFRLETEPLASVVKILDIVEEKVVDSILSNAFPQMCGFRVRRLDGHSAFGFRFYKLQTVEKCDPEENRKNFCGIFTGQVNVYGRDQDEVTEQAVDVIEEALSPSDPSKVHPQLVTLTFDPQYLTRDGGIMKIERATNRSLICGIGMIVVGLVFLVSVWWFFIRDRNRNDAGSLFQRKRNRRVRNRFYNKGQQNHMMYDPDETSIGPSYETETVSCRDGERLLITNGGRPLFRDHDNAVNSVEDEIMANSNKII